MGAPERSGDLPALAERLVAFGRSCGADAIEVGISEGEEFSVDVRMGEIENLVQAGSRYAGVRLIKDGKTAFATTSDMSQEALERIIRNGVARAGLAQADPFAGLAELSPERIDPAVLDIHDPEISALDARVRIDLALETERVALADRRIVNSYGASCTTNEGRTYLASSNGFSGTYAKTFCSLGVGLQAGDTDDRVEDFWSCSRTHFRDLDPPEAIARKAVSRTVRLLQPRKIKTQRVPVVFEPLMTGGLLGFLFGCVTGTAVYHRTTFLADKLGERIASKNVNVFDDGLLPRRLGSGPFDSEGVTAGRTAVIEDGVLRHFLCNSYAARKLGLKTTGNADGDGVGPNNFYLQPGPHPAADILRSCDRGLLLVRTLGHGHNPVTGDISTGAFGLWIEKGEVAFSVSGITVSAHLGDLLRGMEMVGNDLDWSGPVCGPTIKVAEMLIAGE